MARDTIGNDLIAALTIPIVAAIHHLVELSKGGRVNAESTIKTLDATFCVVLWFAGIGPLLYALAAVQKSYKRYACISIPVLLCSAALYAQPAPYDPLRRFPSTWLRCITLLLPMEVGCLGIQVLATVWRRAQEPDSTTVYVRSAAKIWHKRFAELGRVLIWLSLAVCAFTWVAVCISVGNLLSYLPKDEEGHTITSSLRIGGIPQSGASVTELDQAIAMGAGVLTLACSIIEAILSWRRSGWEKYNEWRMNCANLIEQGLLSEEETLRWKEYLENIVQWERELLDTPTNTELSELLAYRKELAELEHARNQDARVQRSLRQYGFI
jgi:hypothetical protein